MRTPAEFLAKQNTTDLNPIHLAQIRGEIDSAIDSHRGNGYTVKVPTKRSNWLLAEVSAVIKEYVAAGWIADTGNPSYMVVLTANPSATGQP